MLFSYVCSDWSEELVLQSSNNNRLTQSLYFLSDSNCKPLRYHCLQPEKFDPDRFLPELVEKRPAFSYMPFGLGPKQCIGLRMAQLELKMALVEILQKVKFERRMDSIEKLEFHAATILQPRDPVYIKVVARSCDINRNN